MRELGVEPVIYTPENPHYPILDPGLESLVPKDIAVYRRRIWEPYGFARRISRAKTQRISSGIISRERPSALERFLLWVRGNLFIPDARKYWIKPSVNYLSEILGKEGIDTVITTGPPHSMHLIGLSLKKRLDIRWIADFRDPWTSIGYHSALALGKRARKKHEDLEAEVLAGADAIITTSAHTCREFQAKTQRPIHVLTNGFVSKEPARAQPSDRFRLAHIGSLLSGRNPISLWKALSALLAQSETLREDLEIELTGVVSEEVRQAIVAHGLEPYLTLRPYVPHEEALKLQGSAQVLLLLEMDRSETVGIIPGKLFEYMAASRPVLAIGPQGWEAGKLVEDTGCGASFHYDEEAEIQGQLLDWYQEYQEGNLSVEGKGVGAYHRKALTERLVKEILWA